MATFCRVHNAQLTCGLLISTLQVNDLGLEDLLLQIKLTLSTMAVMMILIYIASAVEESNLICLALICHASHLWVQFFESSGGCGLLW